MIVGVTGHRFYDEPTASYLIVEVRELLSRWKADDGDLRLVSLLAEGADQLVASIAVDLDVPVDVVLPFEAYRESLEPEFRDELDRLLAVAASVVTARDAEQGGDAYLAAGLEVVRRSDRLIAIWDGQEARGTGGTGDIVEAAHAQGVDVVVLWPDGYVRVDAG